MTAVGLVLNNRYRLLELLATGGMGEVWRADDELLARPVAVKLLRLEHVSDEQALARFQAEARYAAALQHVGIAQVFDYGEQDEHVSAPRAYLVMELVSGEPLSRILARTGRLTPDTTLDLVAQAARALQIAHSAGIVHRDVKPGNLMVTADGTLKITDFGIARGLKVSTLTQTGMVMGTAHYVSPEQATGRRITPATDLYSLGVVAYECLAGKPPFDAEAPVAIALKHVREAPPELSPDIPAPVRELVRALLAKDVADRPGDAQEVADRAFVIRDALLLGLPAPADGPNWADTAERTEAVSADTQRLGRAQERYEPVKLDGGGPGDTLASEEVPGQRRTALLFTSVAAGVVLLGVIVVGSLWRGPASADLDQSRDKLPAGVLPGPVQPGRPATPVPGGPTGDPPRPGQLPPSVNNSTASTIPTPSASSTGRPSPTPTRKPTTPPKPTPTPTKSTPPPSTPSPDPSSTKREGLGSE